MSEKAIQEGIQDTLQAMSEFATADIVINDWNILDQTIANAPYVRIENSDAFTSRQDATSSEEVWEIPVTIIVAFTEWTTSLDSLRDLRQAIIDEFNTVGGNRSAGGTAATTADIIRSGGPLLQVFDPYNEPEHNQESLPIFLAMPLIFEFREF